jgi:Na+-transporting NADH:ubiquinone oxidoreductase subunit D
MNGSAQSRPSLAGLAREGIWTNNPIFKQILGICSTLAVTNMVLNTLVMCAALVLTLAMSSLTISWLRRWTPRNIRMMLETLVIAFYVIVVDVALKAYWPEMSTNLGPYVGLIITNCIVMGRAEACANSNPPFHAFMDGLFNGIGYALVLLVVAIPREIMGMGTVAGFAKRAHASRRKTRQPNQRERLRHCVEGSLRLPRHEREPRGSPGL